MLRLSRIFAAGSGGVLGTPAVLERVPRNVPYVGPLQAGILDWSGTIADPHVIAPAVVFVEVFNHFGCPISMHEARGPMGLRKDLHIQKILELPDVAARWQTAKGRKIDMANDVAAMFEYFVPAQCKVLPQFVSLLPGAAEATQYMQKELNMKLGSTTGFTRIMVDELLAGAMPQGYNPDTTIGGDEVENGMGFRPTPYMIYKNLVQLKVWPIESVVKVDDTTSGVDEGITAGCWSVGVAGWSNYTNIDTVAQWDALPLQEKKERVQYSRELLNATDAHYITDSIRELPAICHDINRRLANGETPQGTREQVRVVNEDMSYLEKPFPLCKSAAEAVRAVF
jgi:phosphonoacetaldehyde hydrolase